MSNINVITLDNLGDTQLPRYIADAYYIYYKTDGDLYLYDSYRDVEWNLFHLSAYGFLRFSATKELRGILTFTATQIENGIFTFSATMVSDGTFTFNAVTNLRIGSLIVTVKEYSPPA